LLRASRQKVAAALLATADRLPDQHLGGVVEVVSLRPTVSELIRELQTFQPDSEVLVAVVDVHGDWQSARPGTVYWDADARMVVVEGEL
jgi:hypothetical protein